MSKFDYDDVVRIGERAPPDLRPGASAWVIAIFPDRSARPGSRFDVFPDGAVYTVEYEDGSTAEVHEDDLTGDEAG